MRTDKCVLRFAVAAACTLSTVLVAAQEHSSASDWIRAPALKPGDTIALVAPAGPAEWPPVRAYADALRKAGYKVRVPEDVAERKCGYLAGTDSERAAELNAGGAGILRLAAGSRRDTLPRGAHPVEYDIAARGLRGIGRG